MVSISRVQRLTAHISQWASVVLSFCQCIKKRSSFDIRTLSTSTQTMWRRLKTFWVSDSPRTTCVHTWWAASSGNNWAQNKDLWVDRTYIVHSTSLWINIPNHEALTCNHWAFLSLRRHISHNLAFSSHLTDTTSNQLQSLPVKPHFCCPEASDSLPARTQEWVKIKGDFFCHYPVWTPTYAEGEGRFFPEKRRRDRMSRAAWNPIMTADIKKKKKTGRKSSSCHIVVYESPESLSAPQQICAPWQPHESTRSLLRFKAKPTKRSALVEAWGNVILLKIAFLSQTIRFHYFRFSF